MKEIDLVVFVVDIVLFVIFWGVCVTVIRLILFN